MKLMKLTNTFLTGTFLRCEFRPSQQPHIYTESKYYDSIKTQIYKSKLYQTESLITLVYNFGLLSYPS